MNTEAHINVDHMARGIKIIVLRRNGDEIRVLKDLGGADRFPVWDFATPGTEAPAGIRIEDDVAKALLDALLDHYRGGHDARELRKDYDAERARVDIFIKHLTGMS